SRNAGCPAAIRLSSTAAAIVGLPAPGSPVNQTVAPCCPSVLQRRSRVTREPCHTTLGLRPPAAESASSSTSVSRITPAATVSLLPAPVRIRLPVARFLREESYTTWSV